MYGELHANRVLYRETPQVGTHYRQIALVEAEQFEVRIFEGTVAQMDPKFVAESPDAEVYFYGTLAEARADVEREFQESVASGWRPYNVE